MTRSETALHKPGEARPPRHRHLREAALCILTATLFVLMIYPWGSESFLRLSGQTKAINDVVFGPGDLIATASDDASIRLWTHGGELTRNITGHSDRVVCLAFSPSGERLASGSGDGEIRIWDVATGIEVSLLHETDRSIGAVTFDGTGTRLYSVGWHSALDVWDTGSGRLLERIPLPAAAESCILIEKDTRILIGCADGVVRRCDLSTKRVDDALTGHTGGVKGLAIAADGDTVATSALDNTVRLWSLSGQRSLAKLSFPAHVQDLAFCRDDSLLLTGTRHGDVNLIDVKRRVQLANVATPLNFIRSVWCDGKDRCAAGGKTALAVLFSVDDLLSP
ncbi:MAG: hypothetical protein RIK87_08645 [Fuerstiella sp.]